MVRGMGSWELVRLGAKSSGTMMMAASGLQSQAVAGFRVALGCNPSPTAGSRRLGKGKS